MRRFFSYGPLNNRLHFYAPRARLITRAYTQLVGEADEGGHFITVWAPIRRGKTWLMQRVVSMLRKGNRFDSAVVSLKHLETETDTPLILKSIASSIGRCLQKEFPNADTPAKFQEIFSSQSLEKPLVLILDEFDSLPDQAVGNLTSIFKNLSNLKNYKLQSPQDTPAYMLHGLALVGGNRIMEMANLNDSPFGMQRNLQVPNLSFDEIKGMLMWYEKESGHTVLPEVLELVYRETEGHPGWTSWLCELLTEGFEDYVPDTGRPLGKKDFDIVYAAAVSVLPNNNIPDIVSRAREKDAVRLLLKLFKGERVEFNLDSQTINRLYMSGVVEKEPVERTRYYLKFSSPFIQKRLHNYFTSEGIL
ncbi:MAG: ATP-binding protein [bacterium]|nr:ATP-binding protein [bacterium]